jgi:hypothetical protein
MFSYFKQKGAFFKNTRFQRLKKHNFCQTCFLNIAFIAISKCPLRKGETKQTLHECLEAKGANGESS